MIRGDSKRKISSDNTMKHGHGNSRSSLTTREKPRKDSERRRRKFFGSSARKNIWQHAERRTNRHTNVVINITAPL